MANNRFDARYRPSPQCVSEAYEKLHGASVLRVWPQREACDCRPTSVEATLAIVLSVRHLCFVFAARGLTKNTGEDSAPTSVCS